MNDDIDIYYLNTEILLSVKINLIKFYFVFINKQSFKNADILQLCSNVPNEVIQLRKLLVTIHITINTLKTFA